MTKEFDFDVVIIGAGPAGSVAGAKFIQEGFSVLVLEKMEFPRFVIGESLLPQSMDYLEKVGLLECVEKQKFQVKTGVTFYHNDDVCDFLFKDRFSEGWDYTYQVKRVDFDFALIKEVERKGVNVRFNAEVKSVKTSKKEQYILFRDEKGDEQTVKSRFVIDASGYGRVLPKMFKLEEPAVTIPRGSIYCHVNDHKRTHKAGNNIFVHAFNDNSSWIWSIPFSDRTASVGVVGNVDFINECSDNSEKGFKELIKSFPGLEGRFNDTEFIFEPKKILNYSISVKEMHGDGYALCGNSTEFLDPIFSSGVTLAIVSGYNAASLAIEEMNGQSVDWENDYVDVLKQGIDVFRSYVDAWYNGDLHTIFFTQNGNPEFKRQICSVLAGYVWDKSNPFVQKHKRILGTLAKVISMS